MLQFVLYGIAAIFVIGFSALVIESIFFSPGENPRPPTPTSDHDLVRYAAVALKKGLEINRGFRDYGGHGLIYRNGIFVYGASIDGVILEPCKAQNLFASDPQRIEFESEQIFIAWLLTKINEHGPCLPMSDPDFRSRLGLAAQYGLSDAPIPSYPIVCV